MRTLKTETDELPAGVQYDIIQDRFGVRRCQWIGADGLKRSARVDGRGSLARLTHAWPIYDAHVQGLGCNPEEPIPCGFCGEEVAACLTLCPECGKDPDADAPCSECEDNRGEPCGVVEYHDRGGEGCRTEVCRECQGTLKVEAPLMAARQAHLDTARAWRLAQRENQVPAGIGGRR